MKNRENGIARLDQYVSDCMAMMKTEKLEGAFSTIVKREPADIVQIDDEKEIPVEYIVVPEPVASIDKKALLRDLKNGAEIKGASIVKSKNISIAYKVK